MELDKPHLIEGTQIKIGRRILRRKVKGKLVKKTAKTYSAVYKETNGKWVIRTLDTTNRQAAIRKAFEIQIKLDPRNLGCGGEAFTHAPAFGNGYSTSGGGDHYYNTNLRIDELIDAYETYVNSKSLAKKSLSKYKSDLEKLRRFVDEKSIVMAAGFDEMTFYQYRNWLQEQTHKQGRPYAPKSLYATLTLCKQVFKWAWERKMMPTYTLAAAELPKAKAKPQPCFTTDEVELLLSNPLV